MERNNMEYSKEHLMKVLEKHGWALPYNGINKLLPPEFAQLALLYIIAEK